MKVVIVGSGIAGLSVAIALRALGIAVTVYERAPALQDVGAGISLWANAMRALDSLGAGQAVRQRSVRASWCELRTDEGRRVALSERPDSLERRFGLLELVRMVHRADLLAALRSLLPDDTVVCGHECIAVSGWESRPRVRFANGHADSSDAVIGADGIRSVVRTALFGAGEPRYAGYTCWRGISPRPDRIEPGYFGEWWGRARRFGITTLTDDRVYWFAVENAPPAMRVADDRAHLLDAFRGWAPPVAELIATAQSSPIRGDILDRPPSRTWSRGAVVVVGDAAHAATPNLGQGGAMAIEDAVVLARRLAKDDDPATAFDGLVAERRRRTASIVRRSRAFGTIAQLEGRTLCGLRDAALRLILPFSGLAPLARYARFEVGALPRP